MVKERRQLTTIMFIIFWDFSMVELMWNEVWLLVTNWYIRVAERLKTFFQEIWKYQENLKIIA